MSVVLIVGGAFLAAVLGGLLVAWLNAPGLAPLTPAERGKAWSEALCYVSLHYGGTTTKPGPESDFPRARVRWMVMADGTLFAPYVRLEGGTLERCPDLRVGFSAEPVGGTVVIMDGVSFSPEVLKGGADQVWLSDVRVTPPLPV